ncbi:hypothetical protein [Flavobacterium geliluteum]|uniref:Uncharacterized protein n=1 Tax=Flavobacterium geliluteum TaxID=2816120 RepID=A0A940X6I8_9FLAO|nr:hypothetical protein [Flavobacterium geliluteum]MBP4136920.1 hypothetical protein [Flavobacterium geliluteum]
MKAEITNQETISLNKIEKNVTQILKKINQIRPNLLKKSFKFSKKAQEEKAFLLKNLVSKKIILIEKTNELFVQIFTNTNFSKLQEEDQDFILGLEKIGFINSQYVREIKAYLSNAGDFEEAFLNVIDENLYFMLLYQELNDIETKLLNLN